MFRWLGGVLLCASAAGSAQSSSPASPDVRQAERFLTIAGFTPLKEMRFGGREVHQILPIDPYGMLPIPGVELERHGDGRMTLRAISRLDRHPT